MGKLQDYVGKKNGSVLFRGDQVRKTKKDYIVNAEPGIIVAFRLIFYSNSGKLFTKVISGKILANNQKEEKYIVETRNGLKYVVPYRSILWVKTGSRWPRGVYEEFKQGAVELKHAQNEESAVIYDFTSAMKLDETD